MTAETANKKYVLLDCDGVLINSEEMGLTADVAFAATYGLHFTENQFQELATGLTMEATVAAMNAEHVRLYGTRLPDDFRERLTAHIYDLENKGMGVIEGVVPLLTALRRGGIPFAVASNSGQNGLERKLRFLGLYEYFAPHLYSKDSVANPKPAPDIYLYAMRQLSPDAVPAQCIVVEDSRTGVTAGASAGMHVIGFAYGGHRPKHYPDLLMQAGATDICFTMAEVLEKVIALTGIGER